MKEKIRKLYRLSGYLNLSFALGAVKNERAVGELTKIQNLANDIMEELQNTGSVSDKLFFKEE